MKSWQVFFSIWAILRFLSNTGSLDASSEWSPWEEEGDDEEEENEEGDVKDLNIVIVDCIVPTFLHGGNNKPTILYNVIVL